MDDSRSSDFLAPRDSLFLLLDPVSGLPSTLMSATYLMGLRAAAGTALAASLRSARTLSKFYLNSSGARFAPRPTFRRKTPLHPN